MEVTRIFIRGCGAVSPAGWGVPALMDALEKGAPLPHQILKGPNGEFRVRNVPAPNPRPAALQHPRLRRASAISQYATAAAFEALGDLRQPEVRLGIVIGVHAASIRYSDRFFGEVLKDPATASPVVFPETVINAPASHLAAALNSTGMTYSVLGDQTAFFQALLVGAHWLDNRRADLVLVIGAEETDWTVSTAAKYFSKNIICAEGAGALCISREPGGVEVTAITEPALFTKNRGVLSSLQADLLCDSRTGVQRWDKLDTSTSKGPTLSPRKILGEALSAATAWQFIAAVEKLRAERYASAVISAVGSNQQAQAARLQLNRP